MHQIGNNSSKNPVNMLSMLLLFWGALISQTADAQFDKEKFEKIFAEETSADSKYNQRDSHSSLYTNTGSQDLPQWFINPPVSNNGSIVAIGISDPGLDSADAVNMALLRAEIMANIFRKSTTQLLCDFFLSDQESSQQIVYEHFSRILTQMPESGARIEVLEQYTNAFDETMVLINYFAPEPTSSLKLNKVFFELYKNETEHSIYGGYESIYEMQLKKNGGDDLSMFYQLTEYGPRNDVQAAVGGKEYNVPIYTLSYNCHVNDSLKKIHLSHGLWKEYFKSVISEILIVARQKPENIRVMGDNYQEEAAQSNLYEKLTRGLSVNRMSFAIQGFIFMENALKVRLQEIEH